MVYSKEVTNLQPELEGSKKAQKLKKREEVKRLQTTMNRKTS